MQEAKQGDTIKVHYTGKLNDGKVFDSSREREPFQFTLGGGQVIPGFNDGIVGMQVGDEKSFTIKSDDAYGPHRKELVLEVQREQLPEDFDPPYGEKLEMTNNEGQKIIVTVIGKTPEAIALDANPPLAGEDLTFDVELLEIVG